MGAGPGWVGAVHPWATTPSSALALGAGEPSAAGGKRCRARSSLRRPGFRQATGPWAMAERCASSGIMPCRSVGASSCGVGSRGHGGESCTPSSIGPGQREGQSRATSSRCEVGSSFVRSGRPFRTRSRCSHSSPCTCQNCSVPATCGRPSDAVPAVHRSGR